jgi:hypothetical protein
MIEVKVILVYVDGETKTVFNRFHSLPRIGECIVIRDTSISRSFLVDMVFHDIQASECRYPTIVARLNDEKQI